MNLRHLIPLALGASLATAAGGIGVPAHAADAHHFDAPHLVADSNTAGQGSSPQSFVAVDDLLFFVADDGVHGREVWVTDGVAPPTMLRDIRPGMIGSNPTSMVGWNGVLYFAAFEPDGGEELWRSDGTEVGTFRVADVQPGPAGSEPESLTPYAGFLYFSATNQAGTELWRTDGTEAGTELAADLRPASPSSRPRDLTVVDHGPGDRRLWMIADVVGGSQEEVVVYDAPEGATADAVQTLLADSGVTDIAGFEGDLYAAAGALYRFERTTVGPPAVYGQTLIGGSEVASLTRAGGRLYMSASDSVAGRELHVLNGNTVDLVLDIYPGAAPGSPDEMRGTGGVLYFVATDPVAGEELWRSEGTGATTQRVADLAPGGRGSHPVALGSVLSGLLFSADDQGPSGRELWYARASDGAVFMLDDIYPGPPGSAPGSSFAVVGEYLYVAANDEVHGLEVMRLDVGVAPSEGATDVEPFADLNLSTADSYPASVTAVDDRVVYVAWNQHQGEELWTFQPGGSGPATPIDIVPGPETSWPDEITSLGNVAVFSATGANGVRELWATDGTEAGTYMIDLESTTEANPWGFTRFGEFVYFMADTAPTGYELWRTDGTPAGTSLLADLTAGPVGTALRGLATMGEHLLFATDDTLWISDGTPAGTRRVVTGANRPRAPHSITPTEAGWALFVAPAPSDPTLPVVWRTDGTSAGTWAIETTPYGVPAGPYGLSASGDVVYFGAYTTGSAQAFVTDGTSAGTVALTSPLDEANLDNFAPLPGGRAAFETNDARHGYELTVTDGTPAGTTTLDLEPGTLSSEPAALTAHGEWAYFSADSLQHGRELWRTDGTQAERMSDLRAGPHDGLPPYRSVFPIGDDLYVVGDDGTTGDELWVLRARDPNPTDPNPTDPPTDPTEPPGPPDSPDESPIMPIEPARYLDTRPEPTFDGTHTSVGRLAAGAVLRVPIAGRGSVPAGATGVVANLTVVGPDAPGHATLFPCTPQPPQASHLNYLPGDVLADNAIVPLDATGGVCIYTRAGADYVLDVNGFVADGSPLEGVDPARYLDTRTEPNAATFDGAHQGGGAVPAEQLVEIVIAGRGDVPAGAAAAFVTVTAVAPEGPGYLTLFPCGPRPHASTVNYGPGQTVPNGAVVELSPTGTLCVFTKATAHVLVDVAGYLPAGTDGLHAMAPERLVDTRPGGPTVDGVNSADPARLSDGQTIEIQVAGRSSMPADATAALLNIGLVGPDGPGYGTLYPCGHRPTTSNVNAMVAGSVRANNALTKLSSTGTVCIYVKAGTDLILDATGWVAP